MRSFKKYIFGSFMTALPTHHPLSSTIYRLKLCFKRYEGFAEKRSFQLAHTALGGAPDFRPAASTLRL